MKMVSLGSIASAAAGITCSSSTNATPIVLTIAPSTGHGAQNGDRWSISGITGNTGANGQFTLASVAATAATLVGSVGNGTHGGTAVVSVVCDTTPFMSGYSAIAIINDAASTSAAQAILVGTVLVKSSADDVTFADAKSGLAMIANPGQCAIQVTLKKFMNFTCSAYTSGGAGCQVVNS